jgi:hypothetical protein
MHFTDIPNEVYVYVPLQHLNMRSAAAEDVRTDANAAGGPLCFPRKRLRICIKRLRSCDACIKCGVWQRMFPPPIIRLSSCYLVSIESALQKTNARQRKLPFIKIRRKRLFYYSHFFCGSEYRQLRMELNFFVFVVKGLRRAVKFYHVLVYWSKLRMRPCVALGYCLQRFTPAWNGPKSVYSRYLSCTWNYIYIYTWN